MYSSGCAHECSSCGGCGNSLDSLVGSYSTSDYSGGSPASGIDYMIAAEPIQISSPQPIYDLDNIQKEVYSDNYKATGSVKRVTQTYYSSVDNFLVPARPLTAFIGKEHPPFLDHQSLL